MKIGLVTFYRNYNYGSVLQCYALQSILEECGCKVDVLNQKEVGLYWKIRSLFVKIKFLISCILYPERWVKYKKFAKESNRSCDGLSPKVKQYFDSFLQNNIHGKDVSFVEMRKDKSYDMFICGSDQVWSLTSPMLNPFMFLRFAPKQKRASYAASTGTNNIPLWYKKKLKRYINGFKNVSIREILLVPILEEVGCKNVQQHIDPSLLKTSEFWIKHSIKCNSIKEDNYILLFFLNKPSSVAIEHIKKVSTEKKLPIYSFPYKFDEFNQISKNIKDIDVSPAEFVYVLNNSAVICTDSFHGVAFSINLKKEFYVYNREYSAGESQSSRIDSILTSYSLESRMISNSSQKTDLIGNYDSKLEHDRACSLEYIKKIIA